VKFETRMRRALTGVVLLSLVAACMGADKKKEKPPAAQVVDSGSFGIFINGRRVATETFSIEQENSTSVIKSQLQEGNAKSPVMQKSELDMTSAGALLRYDWSSAAGASLSVFPDNEFLKERITTSATAKAAEQAFLLPSVTPVLDDNFFVQREVLAWKYLAIAPCRDEKEGRKCQPSDFGTLVPQARTSMSVRMELVGKEKVSIRGVEKELLRLNLHGEQFDWALWVDENDHFKLMRVLIAADNTEVVRD